MNSSSFTGRLTADPKAGKTNEGVSFVHFTVAIKRRIPKNVAEAAEGDKKIQTADFPYCVAWKGTADLIAKYCKKGDKVGIEASIRTRWVEDRGENRQITEVRVSNIDFLEPKHSDAPAQDSADLAEDEDIPF